MFYFYFWTDYNSNKHLLYLKNNKDRNQFFIVIFIFLIFLNVKIWCNES